MSSYQIFNKSHLVSGITLIELVITMAVIGIMSTAGIVASLQYNKTQLVDSTAKDFAATVQSAKSRAFSQTRPSNCTGTVTEYQVTLSPESYSLFINCENGSFRVGTEKNIPDNVVMSYGNDETPIHFPVLTGEAVFATDPNKDSASYQFVGDVTKTVTVYKDGRVIVQ